MSVDLVTVEITDALASIDPPCLDLLRDPLTYELAVCRAGGPRGYRLTRRQERLYSSDEPGHLLVPAGLVPRVRAVLEAAGLRVEVTDLTAPCGRLVPDRQLLRRVSPDERAYLEILAGGRRAQVLVGGDKQVVRLTELACRLYPRARVLVVAATRQAIRHLACELTWRLPGQASPTAGAGLGSDLGARVLVTTTPISEHAVRDTDRFHVVVLADAAQALATAPVRRALHWFCERQVIGFVRSGRGPATNLFVEAICGPVVYEAPSRRVREARVDVVFAEPPLAPWLAADNALEFKRGAIWHNPTRNLAVAELAAALADGADDRLFGLGLLRPGVRLPGVGPAGRHVVVVVESTEHGRELLRLLPAWKFFSAATAKVGSRLPDSGPPARSIVTLMAAQAARELAADAVVWAGGGGGPDLPGFPPRRTGRRQHVAVLDLADESNQKAEADTRRRLRAYRRRGWDVSAPPRWLTAR